MVMRVMIEKRSVKEGGEFPISWDTAEALQEILDQKRDSPTKGGNQFTGYKIVKDKETGQNLCKLSDYTVGIIQTEDAVVTIKPRFKEFDYRTILRMWMYVNYNEQNHISLL